MKPSSRQKFLTGIRFSLKLFLAFLLGALVENIDTKNLFIAEVSDNMKQYKYEQIEKNINLETAAKNLSIDDNNTGIITIASNAIKSNSNKKIIYSERESEFESFMPKEMAEAPPDSENFHLDKPPRIFTLNSS